jgi:hypothetical protein
MGKTSSWAWVVAPILAGALVLEAAKGRVVGVAAVASSAALVLALLRG